MNNDQLAALLNELKAEILEKIEKQGVATEFRLSKIEAKLTASVPTPLPPVESIWDDLEIEDPLASYEQTDAGWINQNMTFPDFPGDKTMLDTGWFGVEAPTGRVMHGGDKSAMGIARAESMYFHDLDVAGKYDGTPPANANVSPEVAACLLCLRLVDLVQGGLGSNASRSWAAWANTTSLEELYRKLKAASEGTGGPSGGQ